MPPEPVDALNDAHQLRHHALSRVTIIQGQAQLLQRHLQRMNEFSDGDRQRLEQGLARILDSTHALCTLLEDLPAIPKKREER